jgi:hypothetical protein
MVVSCLDSKPFTDAEPCPPRRRRRRREHLPETRRKRAGPSSLGCRQPTRDGLTPSHGPEACPGQHCSARPHWPRSRNVYPVPDDHDAQDTSPFDDVRQEPPSDSGTGDDACCRRPCRTFGREHGARALAGSVRHRGPVRPPSHGEVDRSELRAGIETEGRSAPVLVRGGRHRVD